MHAIRIDRGKPLAAEPHLGHNRYHPDIAPVAEIGEGEEIALETRDALDGQIKPGMAAAEPLVCGAEQPDHLPDRVDVTLANGRSAHRCAAASVDDLR